MVEPIPLVEHSLNFNIFLKIFFMEFFVNKSLTTHLNEYLNALKKKLVFSSPNDMFSIIMGLLRITQIRWIAWENPSSYFSDQTLGNSYLWNSPFCVDITSVPSKFKGNNWKKL